MAVREGLLALLSEQPKHGYQLKTEFEARTGQTWPLNVGQVYGTLARLASRGLVAPDAGEDGEDERRRRWELTGEGRRALDRWFLAPPPPEGPAREDLVLKVLLAVDVPGVDPVAVVRTQRTALVERLQPLRRRQREARTDGPAAAIVADALAIRLESEIRWLDRCEDHLAGAPAEGGRTS